MRDRQGRLPEFLPWRLSTGQNDRITKGINRGRGLGLGRKMIPEPFELEILAGSFHAEPSGRYEKDSPQVSSCKQLLGPDRHPESRNYTGSSRK